MVEKEGGSPINNGHHDGQSSNMAYRQTLETITRSRREVERRFKNRGTCERIGWATRLRKSGRKRRLEGALKRDCCASVLGGLLG